LERSFCATDHTRSTSISKCPWISTFLIATICRHGTSG
jgi:hypothetical protein